MEFSFSSILNKLTPEKFHKLSEELLSVGLDSTQILKGVILLVSVAWIWYSNSYLIYFHYLYIACKKKIEMQY